jgi:hypothetical protein
MSVLRDFEVRVLRLLVSGLLSAEQLAALISEGELERYDYSGVGYFLTLRHQSLPVEGIACHVPVVSGSADGVTCGFIAFIEGGRLTIECHTWEEAGIPEDFRDRDVQVTTG